MEYNEIAAKRRKKLKTYQGIGTPMNQVKARVPYE